MILITIKKDTSQRLDKKTRQISPPPSSYYEHLPAPYVSQVVSGRNQIWVTYSDYLSFVFPKYMSFEKSYSFFSLSVFYLFIFFKILLSGLRFLFSLLAMSFSSPLRHYILVLFAYLHFLSVLLLLRFSLFIVFVILIYVVCCRLPHPLTHKQAYLIAWC